MNFEFQSPRSEVKNDCIFIQKLPDWIIKKKLIMSAKADKQY